MHLTQVAKDRLIHLHEKCRDKAFRALKGRDARHVGSDTLKSELLRAESQVYQLVAEGAAFADAYVKADLGFREFCFGNNCGDTRDFEKEHVRIQKAVEQAVTGVIPALKRARKVQWE